MENSKLDAGRALSMLRMHKFLVVDSVQFPILSILIPPEII